MDKSNEFSSEFRERSMCMVQEPRGEYPSLQAAAESIAPQICCVPQTLLVRGKRQGGDAEGREGVTTVETWRVKNLQHEVKELRRTIGVLKQASDFFSQAQLDR